MAANMAAISKGLSCEKWDVGLSAPNYVHITFVTKELYVQIFFAKIAANMAAKMRCWVFLHLIWYTLPSLQKNNMCNFYSQNGRQHGRQSEMLIFLH